MATNDKYKLFCMFQCIILCLLCTVYFVNVVCKFVVVYYTVVFVDCINRNGIKNKT